MLNCKSVIQSYQKKKKLDVGERSESGRVDKFGGKTLEVSSIYWSKKED